MDKKRKDIIAGNAVSNVYEWLLGGYRQKVLVEGKQKNLPVVIALHGGPGTPIPFSVGCRGLFPEFTDRFIMVCWDQLGCGINDYKIDDTFTIDSFVQMTGDLVQEVKKLFPGNKVYLFSMSWGTVLSAKILGKDSFAVDGVVAWGQIVRDLFFNKEVFHALENSGIPRKKFERIKNANIEDISPEELQLISTSIRKYTAGYQSREGTKAPIGRMIKGLLTSPDYNIRDVRAMMVNGYRKNRSLWRELLCVDLISLLREVQIPYIILQGDSDIVTPTKMVKEFIKNAGNANLTCEVVKNSGHIPGKEGMDRVLERLCLFGQER